MGMRPDYPNHGRDKHPFDGITYLYIRTNPMDTGSEPLAAGLQFWVSPDITIIKPDNTEGTVAVAGQMNKVKVKVTNGGGIDAVDAYVEAFVADPSTAFTPATSTLIGGGFLTIPGYSQVPIEFDWSPGIADAGHRCLLARVALFAPPDMFANAAIFDVVGDRHVAQRNISVVDLGGESGQKMSQFSFAFAMTNPLGRDGSFTLRATQIMPRDMAEKQAIRGAVGCGMAQFSDQQLPAMGLTMGDRIPPRDPSEPDDDRRLPMGLLARPMKRGQSGIRTVMKPGEAIRAVLTVEASPNARPGDIQVVEIAQYDDRQQVVGGLWVVVRN